MCRLHRVLYRVEASEQPTTSPASTMICAMLRRTDPEGSRRMHKKYVVDELTKAGRERLLKLLSAGTAAARMLTRARVLLKADVGEHAGECPALIDRQIAGRDAADQRGHCGTGARALLPAGA